MKNFIVALGLIVLSASCVADDMKVNAQIRDFYDQMFEVLENEYLFRQDVDWATVKASILSKANTADSLQSALPFASSAFDAIGCNHCQLFAGDAFYGSSLNKRLSEDDFSQAFVQALQTQPDFSVQLLGNRVGYILIPGMLLIDLAPEALNAETQRLYDQVAKLAKNSDIAGWIVDLRFNTGGNVYPMLAALHPLLGDGIVYRMVGVNGTVMTDHALEDGGFYSGDRLETKVTVSVEPDVTLPVVLITSKMTGSAGEDVVVAFSNRAKTLIVGEPTYGFLTGNDLVELPGDVRMAYTTGFIADADSVYRPFIEPDVTVSKKDDFDDLMQDGNIIEALQFIEQHSQAR